MVVAIVPMLFPSLVSSPFIVENIESQNHNCCSTAEGFEDFNGLSKPDCRCRCWHNLDNEY